MDFINLFFLLHNGKKSTPSPWQKRIEYNVGTVYLTVLIFLILPGLTPLHSSLLNNIYTGISDIFKLYSMDFEITTRDNNRNVGYPYRDNVNNLLINTVGYDQYYGYVINQRNLILYYGCKLDPRMSLKLQSNTTPEYIKLDQLQDYNYWLFEKGNASVEFSYQISPQYRIFLTSLNEFDSSQFGYSFKVPSTILDYWDWIAPSKRVELKGFTVGMKTIQNWGNLGFSVYSEDKYMKYLNTTYTSDEKNYNWLYQDILTQRYGMKFDYNVNPNPKVRVTGYIDWLQNDHQDIQGEAQLNQQKIFSPLTLNYRPNNDWEFELLLDDEMYQLGKNPLISNYASLYDRWIIVKEDLYGYRNRQNIIVNRYFPGLTVRLKTYRDNLHNVYLNQENTLIPEEKTKLWKFWESEIFEYGASFAFLARPTSKLNFNITFDYSPWKEFHTTDMELRKQETAGYEIYALYKPMQLFDLYARKKLVYLGKYDYPLLRTTMRVQDFWDLVKTNNSTLTNSDEIGWNFRYIWATFGLSIIRKEDHVVLYDKDNTYVFDLKSHPWRYSDYVISPLTYQVIGSVKQYPVSADGYVVITPKYVLSDKDGQVLEMENRLYGLTVKYEFSAQFYLQTTLTTSYVYQKVRYVSLSEDGSLLSISDINDNIREIMFALVYRS